MFSMDIGDLLDFLWGRFSYSEDYFSKISPSLIFLSFFLSFSFWLLQCCCTCRYQQIFEERMTDVDGI